MHNPKRWFVSLGFAAVLFYFSVAAAMCYLLLKDADACFQERWPNTLPSFHMIAPVVPIALAWPISWPILSAISERRNNKLCIF